MEEKLIDGKVKELRLNNADMARIFNSEIIESFHGIRIGLVTE